MKPLGIVTGLEAEARLARRWGVPVAVGGGTPEGAAHAAARLAPEVSGLVSFGLAGGLDPALAPGDLLVPALVTHAGQIWPTNPTLNAALGGCTGHTLLGGGTILATLDQKRAAHAAGAQAVDLESAAVADIAGQHALPFAVVRAICDPATRALPNAALIALDSAGRIAALRIALALLSRPWDIAGLLALAQDAHRARAALIRRIAATTLS